MPSILFVCSANQCRSPMVQVLFEAFLVGKGVRDEWRVESAGVWAYDGSPATANAQKAMAERGLDLSRHLSQPASSTLLKQFDLTLVMEQEHKTALQDQNPQLADRIYLMREIAGQEGDFADPVGGSLERYRAAADELGMLMRDGMARIDELVKAPGL
ncbi:MAG: low molecular weight protein arginine phosphatase [Chloroflexi bacterium]|nr:low molecular weight protein arginine phosphatase [Chloroflexota bacterium]